MKHLIAFLFWAVCAINCLPLMAADDVEKRVKEYREVVEKDLTPLTALKDGMTSAEVKKLFPKAKSGIDAGAPILFYKSATGRKVVIYFHKATGKMSIVNVYWFGRDGSSEVTKEMYKKLRDGARAKWTREDVVKLMGLPDHMRAIRNSYWIYGGYRLRFSGGELIRVSPPPRKIPMPR